MLDWFSPYIMPICSGRSRVGVGSEAGRRRAGAGQGCPRDLQSPIDTRNCAVSLASPTPLDPPSDIPPWVSPLGYPPTGSSSLFRDDFYLSLFVNKGVNHKIIAGIQRGKLVKNIL